MNILQIGLGFIGSAFKENEDQNIQKYTISKFSVNEPISNLKITSPSGESLFTDNLPSNLSSIVVFAYSEDRRENFKLVKKIFSLAKILHIKKIIYIGTTAKYDIQDGQTDEGSSNLKFRDFYARTKLEIISSVKAHSTRYDGSVIVLHPTIVLGNGGNWNRTIINNLRHGNILLPKSGSGYCNPVHVSDVCHAVSQAILSKPTTRYREYIVSSGVIMSWKEIYQAARTKLLKNDIQCGLILNSHDHNSFSAKPLLNFTYFFIYSSFGFLLLKLLRYLRPIKKLRYSSRTFPKYDPLFINEPRGVYRLLYSKKQIFSIERIQSEMDYRPNFDNSNKLKECLVVKSDQR